MISRLQRTAAALGALACLATAPSAVAQKQPAGPGPSSMISQHGIVNELSDAPLAVIGPDAAIGLARVYSGPPINVTTFHYDNYRTGWNASETDLTPANVNKKTFGILANLAVDGQVYAQPLLVSNVTMPDSTVRNVLILATEHNSVYAFDAQTYAVLWQVNLGPSQSATDVACVDVKPELGISSTPVIVAGPNPGQWTIYVVASTETPGPAFQHQLHALDLTTGLDTVPPVTIAPSGTLTGGAVLNFSKQYQYSRAGLAYNNGHLYVGISSHCDNTAGKIAGWLQSYDPGLNLQSTFQTTHKANKLLLGSIWMSGFAPAIDDAGNVYVSTGNGAYDGVVSQDWGQSVLKLSPDLGTVLGSFTPANFASLNLKDLDLGAGGVVLLPVVDDQTAPPMAAVIGKDPTLYLLDQNNLGGFTPTNSGALQALTVNPGNTLGVWGGSAFYNGPNGPTLFIQIHTDYLRAFSLSTGASPTLTLAQQNTRKGGYAGTMPVVSSNGAQPGTGVVWIVHRGVPPALEAYDANNLGAPIYLGATGNLSKTNAGIFLTPMVANGRVYVATSGVVSVFGLLK